MISEYFTKRFGLTKEGSDNLVKGIIYTALLNIAFMFPVGLYALLIITLLKQFYALTTILYFGCNFTK